MHAFKYSEDQDIIEHLTDALTILLELGDLEHAREDEELFVLLVSAINPLAVNERIICSVFLKVFLSVETDYPVDILARTGKVLHPSTAELFTVRATKLLVRVATELLGTYKMTKTKSDWQIEKGKEGAQELLNLCKGAFEEGDFGALVRLAGRSERLVGAIVHRRANLLWVLGEAEKKGDFEREGESFVMEVDGVDAKGGEEEKTKEKGAKNAKNKKEEKANLGSEHLRRLNWALALHSFVNSKDVWCHIVSFVS